MPDVDVKSMSDFVSKYELIFFHISNGSIADDPEAEPEITGFIVTSSYPTPHPATAMVYAHVLIMKMHDKNLINILKNP
jgi:hypothetical protein